MKYDNPITLFQHLLILDEDKLFENLATIIDEKNELYAEVAELISAHEANRKQTGFNNLIGKQAELLVENSRIHELENTQVGIYKLIKKLGEGGMGVVYMGERNDGQLEHKVAIKFVYPSIVALAGENFLQKEAQHLANLEHPNIAKINTIDTSDNQLPYMVMEYVDGVSIDQYCQQNKLNLAAKLRLFKQVCNAVQFAHQNMVIHADIKPSNILVDKQGLAKLMDFGIASSINSDAANEYQQHFNAASPEFASPEQLAGSSLTISTDIYALGKTFLKIFNTKEIPSLEFDAITEAALSSDKTKQFKSVSYFEQSIEELLNKRPVNCVKGKRLYKLRKLITRNPISALSVLALTTTVVASAFTLTLQNQRLIVEKQIAEQSVTFLENVFEFSSPYKNQNNDTTVKELLANALNKLDNNHSLTLESANRIKLSLAMAHATTGSKEDAEKLLLSINSSSKALTLKKMYLQAQLASDRTDFDSALSIIEKGLAQGVNTEFHEQILSLLTLKANIKRKLRSFDDATKAIEELLAYAKRVRNLEFEVRAYDKYAALYFEKPQYEGSAHYGELALTKFAQYKLTDNTLKSTILYNYGSALEELEQFDKAEDIYRQVVELDEKVFGTEHPNTGQNYNLLSYFYHTVGDYQKALEYADKAIAIHKQFSPYSGYEYTDSLFNKAHAYKELSQPKEAIKALLEAESVFLSFLPKDHHKFTNLYSGLGVLHKHISEFELGTSYLTKALDIALANKDAGRSHTASIYGNLANIAITQKDYDSAEEYLQQRYNINVEIYGTDSSRVSHSLLAIARLYRHKGDLNKASATLQQAIEIAEKAFPADHPSLSGYYAQKAIILEKLNEPKSGIVEINKALKLAKKSYGEESFQTHGYNRILANLLLLEGKGKTAHELALAALSFQINLLGEDHAEVKRVKETLLKAKQLL